MLMLILFYLILLGCCIFVDTMFLSLLIILIIITFIIHYAFFYGQANDIAKIQALHEKKKIYEQKASALIPEFKKYLGEIYPNIEKEIFDNISPKNIQFYLAKYPEIQSNKTIIELTSLINKTISKVYNCDLKIEDYNADIAIREKQAQVWLFFNIIKKNK